MSIFTFYKQMHNYKKGYKAALSGDFESAISFFNKAYLFSFDFKTQSENSSWYHLCLALKSIEANNLNQAKESFNEFTSVHKTYVDFCKTTPGIGTEVRYNTWFNSINNFMNLYQKQFNQLKD